MVLAASADGKPPYSDSTKAALRQPGPPNLSTKQLGAQNPAPLFVEGERGGRIPSIPALLPPSPGGSYQANHVSVMTHGHAMIDSMQNHSDKVRAKYRTPWDRDEMILALALYLRIGPVGNNHKEVRELADLISRTPGSVSRRLANYQTGIQKFHGVGLPAGWRGCEPYWKEFQENPNRAETEAAAIRLRFESGI